MSRGSRRLALVREVASRVRQGGPREHAIADALAALCLPSGGIASALLYEVDLARTKAVLRGRSGRGGEGEAALQTAALAEEMLDGESSPVVRAIRRGIAVETSSLSPRAAPEGDGVKDRVLVVPVIGTHPKDVRGALVVVLEQRQPLDGDLRYVAEVVAMSLAHLLTPVPLSGPDFLSTVSHELRTPLQAIIGWARILADFQPGSRSWQRGVDAIERNARVEAALVDELLDTSRLFRGGIRLSPEPVRLGPIVTRVVDGLRPAASGKGVTLELTLRDEADEVLGDLERLTQVFRHLVSNAVEFTPAGGKVSVELGTDDDNAVVSIRDNGEGIARNMLPHVFECFWQREGTDTRSHGGLGLGLSLVQHVLELHGGRIRAESEGEGRGAAFTVEVPLLGTMSVPIERRGRLLDGLRVLIVEDEDDAREAVAMALASFGAEVLPAATAADALAALARGAAPDVVVTDILLPDEDGYSLLRKLRAQTAAERPAPAALALTGLATNQDRERALAAGFQAHVPKPVRAAELARTIAALSGRRPRS